MMDYEDDIEAVDEDQLAYITRLAEEQQTLEALIEEKENELKDIKHSLRAISMDKLPTAMADVGIETFKTITGLKVDVSNKLSMNIPKKNIKEVVKWLIDNGQAALIKNEIIFTFDKEQHEEYAALHRYLTANVTPDFVTKESVHTAAVKAVVKELKELGTDIPMKLLGGFDIRQSVITKP